jgi:hypothetical protein
MTRWTDFIKEWAKENNTTYGCAMSEPKMKEEYYKKYPKQTKEQKKEDEEKQRLSIFRGSIKNFRDKFVKPYLENKDPILKNDMINKYRKFSQRLKDYIRDNAPKIHEIVNKLAEQKDERQIKKGLMKPKPEPKKKPEVKKPEVKEANINEVFNLDNKKFSIIEKIEKNLKPLDFKKLKEKDIKQLLQAEKSKPSGLFNSKGNFNLNEKNKNFINKNRIKIIQFIEGTGGKSKGSALSGEPVGVKRGVNIDYLDNNGNYKTFTVLRHRGDTIYIYDGDKIIDSSFNGVSSFVNKERHIEEYEKLKKQILIDGKNKKWKDKYLKYVDKRIEEIKNTPEEKKPKAHKNISPEELRTAFI